MADVPETTRRRPRITAREHRLIMTALMIAIDSEVNMADAHRHPFDISKSDPERQRALDRADRLRALLKKLYSVDRTEMETRADGARPISIAELLVT